MKNFLLNKLGPCRILNDFVEPDFMISNRFGEYMKFDLSY